MATQPAFLETNLKSWKSRTGTLEDAAAFMSNQDTTRPRSSDQTTAHEIAVDVFTGLTMATTLMLRVSLLLDFQRMLKNHSTGETPCLLLFTNCYAIMFYALAIDNSFPLFAVSILGVVTGIFFNYFSYRQVSCFLSSLPSTRDDL
ncbi:hypothetical protein PI124_g17453 [Phytophthora idaei]|nr:hypothetical protein PI124_g17453 [Phytophthora idaei]